MRITRHAISAISAINSISGSGESSVTGDVHDVSLTIECFGAFRVVGDRVVVSAPLSCSVAFLKERLVTTIGEQYRALVSDSVMVSEVTVLGEHDPVPTKGTLAILPPVCGG